MGKRVLIVDDASGVRSTIPGGANGRVLTSNGAGGISFEPTPVTISISFNGNGSPLSAGIIPGIIREIPYDMTITGWRLLADQAGDLVLDVWKSTYATYPPIASGSITGSEKPTLSSAIKNQDLSLSTWNTALSAGDILIFNIDSASLCTYGALTIFGTRP